MQFDPYAPFQWKLAHGRALELGPRSVIMGILNVTPDSFSDGGRFDRIGNALAQVRKMRRAGAAIIDIGGESTRPGADPVSAEMEQQRVLPVIGAIAAEMPDLILSVDTYRASTAKAAIEAGAHVINDVWGFQKDPEIADIAARSGAGCVIMHTGRERTRISDVIKDQMHFLGNSLMIASNAGIPRDRIVLDPGFGFAKEVDENIELLARMEELFALGCPILTGTSRKRFVAALTGKANTRRDNGTAATSAVARMKGSAVFRVHDVQKNRDALAVADAVIASGLERR
jgi:dihydropteroate synthase